MGTLGPNDRPGEDESLEPFGKDRAGHAGNAPADIVEAAAARQDFPYDQEGPPPAQHFVGARHGAELSVSRHVDNLARRAPILPVRIPYPTPTGQPPISLSRKVPRKREEHPMTAHLLIIYPIPKDTAKFDRAYREEHLPYAGPRL